MLRLGRATQVWAGLRDQTQQVLTVAAAASCLIHSTRGVTDGGVPVGLLIRNTDTFATYVALSPAICYIAADPPAKRRLYRVVAPTELYACDSVLVSLPAMGPHRTLPRTRKASASNKSFTQ